MKISFDRKPSGVDWGSFNPAYNPDWVSIPKNDHRFDGEIIDVQVLFASAEYSTTPDKNGNVREILTLELLNLKENKRLTCYLRGDAKTPSGEIVPLMQNNLLNFGKLAMLQNNAAFNNVPFSNFGRSADGYPAMIGMKFKVVVYTDKIATNRQNKVVYYNSWDFFDPIEGKSYREIENKLPATEMAKCLESKKQKFLQDQEKAEKLARQRQMGYGQQASHGQGNDPYGYYSNNAPQPAEDCPPDGEEIPF